MNFSRNKSVLSVLNSDSTLEVFKVNLENRDSILKKLVRRVKKQNKSLKRAHSESESEEPTVRQIDKEAL